MCTPAEIEEKRRQAQQRLLKSKLKYTFTENRENTFGSTNTERKLYMHSNTDIKVLYKSPNKAFNSPGSSKHFKPYDKPPIQFYGKDKIITAKCSLISEDKFMVTMSDYCEDVVHIFKSIPSRSYDAASRTWNFHIKDYDVLLQKIILLKSKITIEKIPSYVLKCCNMPKRDYSLIDLSKIDSELLSSLMPFQIEGVCFAIHNNGKCLIGDDMGLGKTFQALAIASYYRQDWPLLIVTTSSMKKVWDETIHNYLPSVSVMHTQYMVTARDYIGDSKVLIVSPDLLQRCTEKLIERNFGVIIIDESHTFKNFKAKCTAAAATLCKIARRVILLSGTPALSRPNELYTQLTFIDEYFFGNFLNYSKRYCDGKQTNFGWDSSGVSNIKELGVLLSKKFMIRRTKEEVLKMLPNKKQEVISLDVNLNSFSEEDRMKLNSLAESYCRIKRATDKQAALLSYFAETARIKIPSICSFILQIFDRVKKFIVFAHHQVMLNAIEKLLVKSNKGYIRIDGNTSSDKRKQLIDDFQVSENCQCALLSITAANAGITLTAAKLILFAELHWNPSILSQAESRAHRIGQEHEVNVKYLLAAGTADDYIWPMLQEKQKVLNGIGLCKEQYENVLKTKQISSNKEGLTENLNITSLTAASTLDISSYFSSPTKEKGNDVKNSVLVDNFNDSFDDGFNDILANIDI